MINKELRIYEEIMLLALKDKEGTIASGVDCNYALGGAIMGELLLEDKVEVEVGRKKLVSLMDTAPVGDMILDEALEKIEISKRRKRLQGWVVKAGNSKDLKNRVALRLCKKGILRIDEGTVLFLFKRKIYPEIDHEPEQRIIGRLHNAIFSETNDIDRRTIVLLAVASSANILPVIFDKSELKSRKNRVKQVIEGDLVGMSVNKAVKAAIDEENAAVIAACCAGG